MKKTIQNYKILKEKIQSRLNEFKTLTEKQQFQEFLFCLLTPQSNAQRCWQAVEQISLLQSINQELVFSILKTRTRFHITKTKRILQANETWNIIIPYLNNPNRKELRKFIAKTVNGYGLKEASHFLRNIGKSDNQIAILDRHILKNLQNLNLIKENKVKSPRQYFEIENIFLNFANSINIPPDELDLLWWSQENGEIFK